MAEITSKVKKSLAHCVVTIVIRLATSKTGMKTKTSQCKQKSAVRLTFTF